MKNPPIELIQIKYREIIRVLMTRLSSVDPDFSWEGYDKMMAEIPFIKTENTDYGMIIHSQTWEEE